MTWLPIVERELRAQARLGLTYGMRVAGALALLLLLAWMYIRLGPYFVGGFGGQIFGYLNCVVFLAIWIVVPLISADCISRERREGTLGLLFLTPLKAGEIILAKGLVHGMRALTLWLATLPVLTIPFLIGGVTWREAVLSAVINFSAICWALAAGVAGTCVGKAWTRALLFACFFGACFAVVFIGLNGAIWLTRFGWAARFGQDFFDRVLVFGLFGATDSGGWWGSTLATVSGTRLQAFLLCEGALVPISLLVLAMTIRIAASSVRRNWQELPPSATQQWLQDKLCEPIVWVSFFRRWMRRKLERNPIGWLEQRTWSGRVVTWGWFAVMVGLYGWALDDKSTVNRADVLQRFMAWLLLGVMAVTAAGSFQRERETGVLELLLVSPLKERQIISGRLRGLWGQYLPAMVVLLGIWTYLDGLIGGDLDGDWKWIEFFGVSFVTLPVVGLYCSLRRRNFIAAFLSTVFIGLVLPFVVKALFDFAVASFFPAIGPFDSRFEASGSLLVAMVEFLYNSHWPVMIVQGYIAFRLWGKLNRDLGHRNFAFSRPPG
jgi:ABC-type transport system involved in multi-copper enzyme maturation permease subunit